MSGGARICILTSAAKGQLFGAEDAIGNRIEINGLPFLVTGVVEGQPNEVQVLFPVTAAKREWLANAKNFNLLARMKSEVRYEEAQAQLESALRRYLGMPAGDGGNSGTISISVPAQRIKRTLNQLENASYRVGFVGLIALLIAGMGTFNLLLVSVHEDIRELGLRRAVGATRLEVALTYMKRAIGITLVAAAAGSLLSIFFSAGLAAISKIPGVVPLRWILFAGFTMLLIGLTAGLTPAIFASRVSPGEALRHE
jgi:putative ABC transport system permease protein